MPSEYIFQKECRFFGGGGCIYLDEWCPYKGNKKQCEKDKHLGDKSYYVEGGFKPN